MSDEEPVSFYELRMWTGGRTPADGEPDETVGITGGPTKVDADTGEVLETAQEHIADVARVHGEGECDCTKEDDVDA